MYLEAAEDELTEFLESQKSGEMVIEENNEENNDDENDEENNDIDMVDINEDIIYEEASIDRDGCEIALRLMERHENLTRWLKKKPDYHEAVKTIPRAAKSLINKLNETDAQWPPVIEHILFEINQNRKQKAIQIAKENKAKNKDKMIIEENENSDDQSIDSESNEQEEYVGSDEFVSGLLFVTVYLSRQVFIKKSMIRSIRHIKAFDAMLDILQDGDEVVGITECFPLPINDKQVHKENINKFDTGLLYEKLKPKWNKMSVEQPPGMKCILWKYQRKAVSWMLNRERNRDFVPDLLWREMDCYYEDINNSENNQQYKFWYQIDDGKFHNQAIPQLMDVRGGILADQMGLGKTVECIATIILNPQTHWAWGKPVKSAKCHIFDEDDDEDEDDDIDANNDDQCIEPDQEALQQFERNELILCESAATLIVTPTNIIHQWKNEINRHAPHLKVCLYLGQKAWKKKIADLKRKKKQRRKRKSSELFQGNIDSPQQPRKRRKLNSLQVDVMPVLTDNIRESGSDNDGYDEDIDLMQEPNYRNLGKYDIVLTDYTVLKQESDYSKSLQYVFRRKKRHQIPDTPLLQIRWWRLILDEAQQIENKVSKCAQMASRVSSKNKWCVTGTPIGKNGLDDLYGLIKFLGVSGFDTQLKWLRTIAEPYYNGDDRRLFSILTRLMWRQSKHHVVQELNIPPRKEEFIELTFCGVEHEYYKRLHDDFTDLINNSQHHECKNMTFNQNQYIKKNKSRSTGKNVAGVAAKLEILRQACCHPQISRATFLNTKNKNGGLLTMKQIMTKMIEDAQDSLGQDERELSRAGTYYSDWLIYRVTNKLFDNPNNPDSALEIYLKAIKVLEEVFKIEQSGIDNVENEKIVNGLDDDTLSCDNYDISNLPVIKPISNPIPAPKPNDENKKDDDNKEKIQQQQSNKQPNEQSNEHPNDDKMMEQVVNDLNTDSVSPLPQFKMSISVTPKPTTTPTAATTTTPNTTPTTIQTTTPVLSRAERAKKRAKQKAKLLNLSDDEDYIPSELEQRNAEKGFNHNINPQKKFLLDGDFATPTFKPMNTTQQDDIDIIMNVNHSLSLSPSPNDNNSKFCQSKPSTMKSLQNLKVGNNIAVFMFNKWQPAKIIGKTLKEVVVHFTHFDQRGKNMDHLFELDPEILSIEHYQYALKNAQMIILQKQQKENDENDKKEDKTEEKKEEKKEEEKKKKNRHLNALHRTKVRIEESNEKYYQWKKCEIATAHHLKFIYQQMLHNPLSFHLTADDVNKLESKILVMQASYEDCRKELQEVPEMKVENRKELIKAYEMQIDEWSKELNVKEINELCRIRKKLPIKQWKQKTHLKKVEKYYSKYKEIHNDITHKLQYTCFKLRIIRLKENIETWIPSFFENYDKINQEFKQKIQRDLFYPKIKMKYKDLRIIRTKHSFSTFFKTLKRNFEKAMNEIHQKFRSAADEVNNNSYNLSDQFTHYRSLWDRHGDIVGLLQVFRVIHEEHIKLAKHEKELQESKLTLEAHSAIINDFDLQRYTINGIENYLNDRFEIWKQKALGKSQQLRYLRQKHEILLNAGCRVEQECAICKQKITNPTLTPCGHLFCETCILAWLQSVNKSNHTKACPQCRYRMNAKEVFHVAEYLTQSKSSYLHSSLSSIFSAAKLNHNNDDDDNKDNNENHNNNHNHNHNNHPKSEMSEDEDDDENHDESLQNVQPGTMIDNIDIKGKGDYGTKIEHLVKYIKYLSIEQPDAKSLVYSQYNQLLSIIAALLHENEINCIHQSSTIGLSRRQRATRIEKFKNDPSVKVLLLSLRTDSSGLTLIQATHVFLLEPSFNQAIELQAIDRVHRVGQTKPTFVHRYFMKNTVEENIIRQRYNKMINAKKKRKEKVSSSSSKTDSGLNKGQNREEMDIDELKALFGCK